MKITRFFRDIFSRKRKPRSYRRPFWQRFRFRISNPLSNLPFQISDPQGFFIILNWLGYILLFASAIDYLLILYPPQLRNTQWELQTATSLVNNAWILLIAIILIFLPTRTSIRRFEVQFLSLLRWMVLLGGIIFILLIPLNVINSQRIDQQTTVQIARQQEAREEQLENLEEAIETQNIPPQQLQQLAQALGVEGNTDTNNLKETLITQIETQKQQLQQQATNLKNQRFQNLIRNAVRTNVGALLIGTFLVRLWWETRWVRSVKLYSKKKRS